jgi:hypothetical protein
MTNPNRSPRRIPLAALAALALGVGLASAAEKADKYAKDKDNAATPALKPSVSGKLDAAALAALIDKAVDQRLAEEKVKPSPQADDAEFCRRVYLDLAGHIPPADKAAAFLDSKDADKRAKLIDELLAGEDFGKHQADVWQHLLVQRTSDNRRISLDPMYEWLEKSFNADKPWDKLATDLLTAEGTQEDNGAVTYYLANAGVDKMTDSTTRLFLGVKLQCAQCHNHPFAEWKQTEYWGMAAFFRKVQLEGVNRNGAAQQGATPGVSEGGDAKGKRGLPVPDSAKNQPAKFLGGPEAKLGAKEPARPALARWMTSAENPYFSKAMVNRTWGQLFGRGVINPVDDLGGENMPSHPQLFTDLADQFAANGFDLKYLYRAVCNSRTYQRTSKPSAGNEDADAALYARMPVKVMTPEQQFDSLVLVNAPGTDPRTMKGGQRPQGPQGRYGPNTPRGAFVAFFEVEDADPTEYVAGIPQALRLMNAPQLNNAAVVNGLLKKGDGPAQVVEQLYLVTLSRRPTDAEQQRVADYVAKRKGGEREAYGDVLWALMNSSEFVMNH